MQRVKCAYVFCKVKRAGNLTVQSTVIVLAGSVIDMLDGSYVRSVARILSDVVGTEKKKKMVENRRLIPVKKTMYIYLLLFGGYQKYRVRWVFFSCNI